MSDLGLDKRKALLCYHTVEIGYRQRSRYPLIVLHIRCTKGLTKNLILGLEILQSISIVFIYRFIYLNILYYILYILLFAILCIIS